MAKNIISCSDGTWNKPAALNGTNNEEAASPEDPCDTNVARMYKHICAEKEGIRQVKIYDAGVGTGYGLKDPLLGGTTGAGLDKNIKDVYQFFMLNYEAGDKLFLFGFSRGAYTARSVAGFIRNCGLLKPANIHLIDKAYELYRDRNDYTHPDSDLMTSFRRAYCQTTEEGSHVIPIHFIGVWDTVGALGIPLPWYSRLNGQKYHFHDVTLSSYVRHAYQALAVDERRVLFSPTLWQKSKSVKADPTHHQHKNLEQRWFAGVHSNVGGGYPDCGLSNITLRWLVAKAQAAGLCFQEPLLIEDRQDVDKCDVMNSYTPMYWLWRPRWREIKEGCNDTNQTIDASVRKRLKDESRLYRPANVPK